MGAFKILKLGYRLVVLFFLPLDWLPSKVTYLLHGKIHPSIE